jgi:hypothetical protein
VADVNPARIIIGRRATGAPIVIASPNDLLGLAICAEIEDALAIHAATGLGAWASGGPTRMAALADVVPGYTDFVTIVADRGSERCANDLAATLLRRGIEVSCLGEVP